MAAEDFRDGLELHFYVFTWVRHSEWDTELRFIGFPGEEMG